MHKVQLVGEVRWAGAVNFVPFHQRSVLSKSRDANSLLPDRKEETGI